MRMLSIKQSVLVAIFAVTTFGRSDAGTRLDIPTTISDDFHYAEGVLSTARASANSSEYLGCEILSFPGSAPQADCFVLLNAVVRSCFTTDPFLVQTARGLTSDGFLLFTWDASGTCTEIITENVSYLAPKAP